MRRVTTYLLIVLIITIFLPSVIVKTFNYAQIPEKVEGKDLGEESISKPLEEKPIFIEERRIDKIKIYDPITKNVEELSLDEYIKGVVAAEMPAAFHIEALKAQAVAARTYAISRAIRFEEGHPDHKEAPLCTGVHCQAYLSLEDLTKIHGEKWIEDYWGKIEEAVVSTRSILIYYKGEIIETPYHSTSGGMTEDSVNVFNSDLPYLKSVESPYEEGAPKYRTVVNLTSEEFINILKKKYPNIKIDKENFYEKIKLVEKTEAGRVKKIAIDQEIINGRDVRDLFSLNSTNFKIIFDKRLNLIEIETLGYGHGVGMSQWGANGMAKQGRTYEEILKHYYTGIELIKK